MFNIYASGVDEKHKKRFFVFEALLFTVLYMAAVYFTCGMWFETNDDVFISELLSGKVTGSIDYHNNTNTSVFLTGPLSVLYGITTNIQWWGVTLTIALFLFSFCVIYYSIKKTRSWLQNVFAVGITMSILLIAIHNYGQVQYTSCAMLLAFAGYFVLLCDNDKKKSVIIFALLECFACILRDKSMMLAQPVCFSVVAIYHLTEAWFTDRKRFWPEVRRMAFCFAIIIFFLCAVRAGRSLTYAGDEWTEYMKSDEVRVYLVDYEGKVEYSQLESVLEKYGITEEVYNQFLEYRIWYPDYAFSTSLYEELLPVLAEIRKQESEYNTVLSVLTLLYSSDQFWHLHQFTIALFPIAIIVALVVGRRRGLIPIGAGFIGYLIGIVFLVVRNRYTLRVMMPFYLGVALLLLGLINIMFCEREQKDKTRFAELLREGVVPAGLLVGVVLFALSCGRVQFAYIRRQNNLVNTIAMNIMADITSYCNANPDKTFILDNSYFRGISTPIFESEYYQKANYIYSGSWFGTARSMVSHGKEYLNPSDFYCLVYEAQEWKGLDALEYWEEASGCSAQLYEKFRISSGATIWVYNLKK